MGEIVLDNFHPDVVILLNVIENIESPTTPCAFQRIRRIGNMLEFLQNKLRNDELSLHETGFTQVGDTAVNDHARIQQFGGAKSSRGLDLGHGLVVAIVFPAVTNARREAEIRKNQQRRKRDQPNEWMRCQERSQENAHPRQEHANTEAGSAIHESPCRYRLHESNLGEDQCAADQCAESGADCRMEHRPTARNVSCREPEQNADDQKTGS